MAQTDMLRRYLDAGLAFTKMTQDRAEAIVRDLVRAGEVGSEQASSAVDDIVARSRENTERLFESVRTEIRDQISSLGLATTDDLQGLREEIAALRATVAAGAAAPPPPAPEKKKAPARKATAKATGDAVKLPATKAPATKAAAPRKAAGKAAGTKAPAKKAGPAKKA